MVADRPETGVFLERRSYRRRRLIDALKLLPFLGAWLFLLPAFWPEEGAGTPHTMSAALYYVFGVWLALILACAALVAVVRRTGSGAAKDSPQAAVPEDRGAGEGRRP